MRPILRNSLLASFLAAACGGAWMAWNAFEDHLAEIRKGSFRQLDPNPDRTTPTNGWFTVKVPGENRTPENRNKNAWVQAAEGHNQAETFDRTELAIVKSWDDPGYQIKTHRRAKAAWAEFKNRPATAVQSYSLLKEVLQSYQWADVVDISPAEFYRTLAHQAQRAVGELILQINSLNPEDHYDNYQFYSRLYYTLYDTGYRDDGNHHPDDVIIALNPGVDFSDISRQKNERQKHAETASIPKVVAMYRQGLKTGSAEMKEFHDLFEEFDMGTTFWRTVPEKNSPDYDRWLGKIEKLGLSAEEGAGIVNLIAELNRQQAETRNNETIYLRSLAGLPPPRP